MQPLRVQLTHLASNRSMTLLRRRMLEDMQIRNFLQNTQRCEKKLAPGSILIATSALRFLYSVTMKRPWDVEDLLPMPKKPQTLPS
jgi:hypothetical protein